MAAFSEVDKHSLLELSEQNPNNAIVLSNCFFGGTKKESCGFVPNDWDGITLTFSYKD